MIYQTTRHKELIKKLRNANKDRKSTTEKNGNIAKKLGISITSVKNYCRGNVADGYLGEDILKELEAEK